MYTQHIASISYGKDSLAMIEVIHSHGMPLDRIVHVEIMATPTIPADLPEVAEWKHYADQIIASKYGIQVEHISAGVSFEEMFYGIPDRSEKNRDKAGTIRGFPSLRSQWCSKSLKVHVMNRIGKKGESIQYIGIAADEPARHRQLNEHIRSPLVEHGISEKNCREICDRLGLLAPTYLQSNRSGCWFCVGQPIQQLRLLRKQHPELWEKLLSWDNDSPIPFRHGGHSGTKTIHDFDCRFALEDAGVIQAGDSKFKWSKMDEYKQRLSKESR